MSSRISDVPDIPGSRYAAELRKGGREMRFPADLEREYRRFYLAERRSHVRSFNFIMGVLAVLACAGSIWDAFSWGQVGQHTRLAIIAVAYLTMTAAAHSRRYERIYLETARYASLLIALVGALEVGFRIHGGQGELFALLTAYSIGLYFLAGILYRAAVQANVAMLFSLVAGLIYLHEPATKIVGLSAILGGTGLIGGIAFRHQGIRFRWTFLERGLIAEMALRDGLTGLKNRRAFDEHLVRVWSQALRDRRALVTLMIDVDRFKMFNDRYGHRAGDDALRRIAEVVNTFAKRPLDLAARYGGEEMGIILFDVSKSHAERIAEQLRGAIESLRIAHGDNTPAVVTISIGVGIVHPTLERSPQGAVQLADEALYVAKRDGRNCVRVYETEYQELHTGRFRMH